MIEAEWLAATTPQQILARLRGLPRGATDRGLKFFALHCCRLAWPTIADDRSRRAVEIMEQSLVGAATDEQVAEATRGAVAAQEEAYATEPDRPPEEYSREWYAQLLGAEIVTRATIYGYTIGVIAKLREGLEFRGEVNGPAEIDASDPALAHVLRDIFGHPFRPVPSLVEWRTSTAVGLAAQMYESRDFSAMPILGDALQDAGCDNNDVLEHCRGSGPHVRGCWVVDLVLGKE